jgi:hypothetical protein
VEDGIEQVAVRSAPALHAFPVHHNPAYNEIAAKPGVNGSAIVAFVLGLCGAVPLGVIFGIRALTQIGESPQKGKGLAIAGLCLNALWIVVLALRFAG